MTASPLTRKPFRSAANLISASRASAFSGRLVKVPPVTLPSTSNSTEPGASFRFMGKPARKIRFDGPLALTRVRSVPPVPPMPKPAATPIASPTSPDNFRSTCPMVGFPPMTGRISTFPVDSANPPTRPFVRMISPRLSTMVRRPSSEVNCGNLSLSLRWAPRIVTVPSMLVMRGLSPEKSPTTSRRMSSTRPVVIFSPTHDRVLLMSHSGQTACSRPISIALEVIVSSAPLIAHCGSRNRSPLTPSPPPSMKVRLTSWRTSF